jgi:hypothetical protein
MKQSMSSRERVLATIAGKPADYVPLCFDGICHGILPMLSERFPDRIERTEHLLGRGIDTALSLEAPINSRSGYETEETVIHAAGEPYPLLRRTYRTSRGALEQLVSRTPDYPEHVKLWSDHNVPKGRSRRFLVEKEADLDALELILRPPEESELEEFRAQMLAYRRFCDRRGVLLAGYLQGVGDPLLWMSGVEGMLIPAMEEPEFMDRYVGIVERLDDARLERYLEAGVDLVVRRGWYESTDFWSPALFRRFLQEPLSRQVRKAHQAGVLYCYVMNSGSVPLFPAFREVGFDMYSNFDSLDLKCGLSLVARELGTTMALCGGVNNQHVLERGSEEEVRKAVRDAFDALAPTGRFVLAPGDSVLATHKAARENVETMIDEWRKLRARSW